MADIPVFPAGQVAPNITSDPGFGSIDPNAYLRGLQEAKYQPSLVTAIQQGLQTGVEQGQKYQMNEAALAESAADLQAKQLELQQAPAKLALERMKQESEFAKAQAQIALDQANTTKATSESNKLAAQAKADQDAAKERNGINNLFSSVNPNSAFSIGHTLNELESAYPLLAKVGISKTNNDKGSAVYVDPEIQANVENLASQAEALGDPSLIERANKLVDRFNNSVNYQNKIAGKKPVGATSTVGANASNGDFLDQIVKGTGLKSEDLPVAPEELAASSAMIASGNMAGLDPTDTRPIPTIKEDTYPTSEYGGYSIDLFEKGLPAPVEAVSGENTSEDSIADEIIRKNSTSLYEAKKNYYEQENLAKGLEPAKAAEYAMRAAEKSGVFTTAQVKQVDKLRSAQGGYKESAFKLREALNEIKAIAIEEGIEVDLSTTNTLEQLRALVQGHIPGVDSAAAKRLSQIYTRIQALGNQAALEKRSQTGFTTKTIDTKAEQLIATAEQFGSNATLGQIIQSSQILEARAQAEADRLKIITTYQDLGYDANTAFAAADRFYRNNSYLIDGDIEGRQSFTLNPNRQDPDKFINDSLQLRQRVLRNSEGRTLVAPFMPKTELLNKVTDPNNKEIKYSNIPKTHIDGEPSPDLIKSTMFVESTSLPGDLKVYAISRKKGTGEVLAEGVMQLAPETGKELWKEAGYPGEYNPYDAEKNIAMGTTYMGKMLKMFGGNTELAVAAYNAGPGTIAKAQERAVGPDGKGDGSWDNVKNFLPPKATEETIPYVKKVMGSKEQLAKEFKYNQDEVESAVDALSTPKARNNAQAMLSPQGQEELVKTAAATDISEIQGTVLGDFANALFSMGASEAQAEEPGKAKPVEQNAGPGFTTPGGGSFLLGTARTALFGFDDEGAAHALSLINGTPYEQTLQNVRDIRAEFQRNNPNLYMAGELFGGAIAAVEASLGRQAIFGAAKNAATKPQTVQAMVKSGSRLGNMVKTGLQGALEGFKVAAPYGAAQAVGDADPQSHTRRNLSVGEAFSSRALSAPGGALEAGAVGATLSGLAGAMVGAFKPTKGSPNAISEAAEYISKQLEGTPIANLEENIKNLVANDSDAATLMNQLGNKGEKIVARTLSTSPKADNIIKDIAKERGDNAATELETAATKADSTSSYKKLVTEVGKTDEKIKAAKQSLANKIYSVAKDSMKTEKAKLIGAEKNAKIIYDAQGNVASKKVPTGDIDVPVFSKKGEVAKLLKEDPNMRKAVNKAMKEEGSVAQLPKNQLKQRYSFDVVQRAIQLLDASTEGAIQGPKHVLSTAKKTLQAAAYEENPAYKVADVKFTEASRKYDAFLNKVTKKLVKLSENPENITNAGVVGKEVFGQDATSIARFKKSLSLDGQDGLRSAAIAHAFDLAKTSPEKVKNAAFREKFTAASGDQLSNGVFKFIDDNLDTIAASKAIDGIDSTIPVDVSKGRFIDKARKLTEASLSIGIGVTYNNTYALVRGISDVFEFVDLFARAGTRDTSAFAQEVGKIMYQDKELGIKFLDTVTKYSENKVIVNEAQKLIINALGQSQTVPEPRKKRVKKTTP